MHVYNMYVHVHVHVHVHIHTYNMYKLDIFITKDVRN
jgi:hypothetical protein